MFCFVFRCTNYYYELYCILAPHDSLHEVFQKILSLLVRSQWPLPGYQWRCILEQDLGGRKSLYIWRKKLLISWKQWLQVDNVQLYITVNKSDSQNVLQGEKFRSADKKLH